MALNSIEAQPLLEEKGVESSILVQGREYSAIKSRWSLLVTLVVTHTVLAISGFLAASQLLGPSTVAHDSAASATESQAQPKLWSPLRPHIQYKIDRPSADYWDDQLYFGPPTDESEHAWNQLLHPHAIQITPDELGRLNGTETVRMTNGNSLVMLGALHNLHCLRRIRQTLQADHYYKDAQQEFLDHDRHHTLHCLEAIRSSTLCSPDLTLNRYYWSGRSIHNLSVGPDVQRECVNWDVIADFLRTRVYHEDDIVRD